MGRKWLKKGNSTILMGRYTLWTFWRVYAKSTRTALIAGSVSRSPTRSTRLTHYNNYQRLSHGVTVIIAPAIAGSSDAIRLEINYCYYGRVSFWCPANRPRNVRDIILYVFYFVRVLKSKAKIRFYRIQTRVADGSPVTGPEIAREHFDSINTQARFSISGQIDVNVSIPILLFVLNTNDRVSRCDARVRFVCFETASSRSAIIRRSSLFRTFFQ